MAFKFPFIAALCIAQAFAFLPFEDERITEYDVFVNCWDNQRENLDVLGYKMSRVGAHVLEYLRGELKEKAEKYIKELEEPVAKINGSMFELHNNVLVNLKDKKLPEAAESLMAGIKNVGDGFRSVDQQMQQIVEEVPELSDTMKWMYRYLVFRMKVFSPVIRKTFGKCLMKSESDDDF